MSIAVADMNYRICRMLGRETSAREQVMTISPSPSLSQLKGTLYPPNSHSFERAKTLLEKYYLC